MIKKYIQINFSENKSSSWLDWLFPVFAWIAVLLIALFLFYFLLPLIFIGMIAHLVFKFVMLRRVRKFNEEFDEALKDAAKEKDKQEKIIDITIDK